MKLFISPIFPHSYFVPLDAQDDNKWISMNLAFTSLLTCRCGSPHPSPLSVSIPHPSFSCLQISISFQ